MRIAFIGGGNMAEGMLGAVLRKRLSRAGEVVVAEPQPSRREWIKKKYRVVVTEVGAGAVSGAGLVVLAVKPLDRAGVLEGLKGRLAG